MSSFKIFLFLYSKYFSQSMYRVLCFVLNKLKVFQRFGVNLLLEMAALLRFLDLILQARNVNRKSNLQNCPGKNGFVSY